MNRSPYHLGFSTLAAETRMDDLPIRGTVPAWLTGTLLRTTPARFEIGVESYRHWFDGLAMLYRFTFAAGQVGYANRQLRSLAYREAMAAGRIRRGEFATAPKRNLVERVAHWFSPKVTDNCNVSVNALGGHLVALTESCLPIRFDPDTLDSLGGYAYDAGFKGRLASAHPHLDHLRGCHYISLTEFGRTSKYHLVSIDWKTGRQALVATIPVERPAYLHSFGMTERYLVLAEFPLVVNPLRLRFSGQPFIRNYRWEPQRGTRFQVVDKDTGQIVRTARGPAFFAFHHVNAFEEGDEIVADIVTYPDPAVIEHLYLARLRSGDSLTATGTLTRFRIGPEGNLRQETLAETSLEFPRIHYRHHAGRRYRYVYGAGNERRGNFIDQLVKLDLERGAAFFWHEDGCYPGEPVFVAAPEGMTEDDGAVLSVVLDTRRGGSFLLVLDAASFRELARAEAPHPIPFGFHGNYFAATSGSESFRDLHR